MYLSAKSEKDDIEREYSTQLEAMDEVYHELEVEMQLHDTILGAFLAVYCHFPASTDAR